MLNLPGCPACPRRCARPPLPLALLAAFLFTVPAAQSAAQTPCGDFGLPNGTRIATLETSSGQICLELLDDDAPLTVANFVGYATAGDFDGTVFHRSVPGFVIQGGGFLAENGGLTDWVAGAPVMNEPCTIPMGASVCAERGNERGTVAMAKLGGDPDSATNEWFINLADNRAGGASLDLQNGGFTVFANVLGDGMQVADAIAALPREQDPNRMYWISPGGFQPFLSLPVTSVVSAGSFGCFDPAELTAIATPDPLTAVQDPDTGDAFWVLSRGCGTRIPFDSFVANPGTMSCPDADRFGVAVEVNPPNPTTGAISLGILPDPASSDARIDFSYTCEQIQTAVSDRATWVDDFRTRMSAEFVVIESATVHTVPAAPVGASSAVALLCLGGVRLRPRAPRRNAAGRCSGTARRPTT